jgi:glycosyltransferase involved in cell wall biosynthesis
MNPRVSVVMPSYNHAAFVGEAVQSVLEQSFEDFEFVITDDGSRDGTPDVIRTFSDSRINLEVFSENRGGVVAGNAAIRRSSGEYIARLNSDDFFLPGKLERQVAFLDANPDIAAVFGLPRLINERGNALADGLAEFTYPFSHPRPSRAEWLRLMFFRGNGFCFPTVMMRRSVLDEVGLLDPRLASLPDFDMWVRLCMKHNVFMMQSELTAFRRLDNNRNMGAPRPDTKLRVAFEYFQVLKHYRRIAPEFALKIFGTDLARLNVDPTQRFDIWLAELALSSSWPQHKMFALDTLFEGYRDGDDPRRLIRASGSVDVFGIALADELRRVVLSQGRRQ